MSSRYGSDHETGGGTDRQVLFDAVLEPHRSLTPRAFVLFMTIVAIISFIAGILFLQAGAWPVFAFFCLDAAILYWAFRANYRDARIRERLRLTRDDLTVSRVDRRGGSRVWRFQPYWLQVLIDDPPRHDSPLTLRSHGRSLSIGAFLTPQERLELARALVAALDHARRPALN